MQYKINTLTPHSLRKAQYFHAAFLGLAKAYVQELSSGLLEHEALPKSAFIESGYSRKRKKLRLM